MARQVYFDPFGSYVGGYDKGATQEQNLQTNVRNARDSDYKYNVLNPLELNTLRRNDEVGAVAQPYRLQLPRYGFENARAETFANMIGAGRTAAQYGLVDPSLQALGLYTGQQTRIDPNTQQGGFIDAMGNFVGPQYNAGSVLQSDPNIRKENRDIFGDNFTRDYQIGGLTVQQQNANTAEAAARANATIGIGNNVLDYQKQQAADANDPLFFWNHQSPWTQRVFGGTPAGGPAPTQQAMPQPQAQPQASTGGMPAYLLPNVQQPQPQAPLPQQYAPTAPQQVAQPMAAPTHLPPVGAPGVAPPAATPPAGPISTVDQLVQRMRATNPAAPAVTAAELMAMDPTTQEQYMVQYYPALLQELKSQVGPQTAAPTSAVIQ